jgi:ABC-2 type transport system ATP-binding protein
VHVIEAQDLTKRYGSKVAVDHLSFRVEPGRVTGFLGPNGAGKSTTMRLILGLDHPEAGTATIYGRRYADISQPLGTVGALLEAKAMHSGRSAYNHLLVLAQTEGLPRRRVDEVLALVGLTGVARKRTGGYSLGMSQRVGVAAAMLGNPRVLLLDEPVNGLDPEGILWVRNLIKQLAAEGRTIFVSSHLMSEMALTADHLIVIGRGRLIADCSTQDFIRRSSERSVLVRSPDAATLAGLVKAEGGTVSAIQAGEVTSAQPGDGAAQTFSVTGLEAPRIGELAASAGLVLHELTPRLASLEEAFMELTSGSVEYGGLSGGTTLTAAPPPGSADGGALTPASGSRAAASESPRASLAPPGKGTPPVNGAPPARRTPATSSTSPATTASGVTQAPQASSGSLVTEERRPR